MEARQRAIRILLAAAILAGTALGVRADQPAPNTLDDPNIPTGAVQATADEGPLVPPGDPPDLIFEFTGKVSGYVEPCG